MCRWIAAGLGFALAVTLPVRAQSNAGPEPQFEGRPVSAWVKDLGSKNEDTHTKAATVLAVAGKGAVPALTQALSDKSGTVRERAAEVLGLIGEDAREAVPALTNALKDRSEEVRSEAADALGRIGPEAKTAVGPLIKLLKDPSDSLREAAARGLGGIGPDAKEAVPDLIK